MAYLKCSIMLTNINKVIVTSRLVAIHLSFNN